MVFVLKEAADYILASFTLHLDPETTTSKNTSTIRLQITIKMTIFNFITVADLQGGLGGHVPGPGGPRGPLRAPEKYAVGAARRRGQWAQGLFGRRKITGPRA